MRGKDGLQEALFTVAKLEDFVPAEHPLRTVRPQVNEALTRLNGLFNTIYADTGRASIAPEKLLRGLLIQVFFSVRSERQLMEQVRYNLAVPLIHRPGHRRRRLGSLCLLQEPRQVLNHSTVESFFTEVMTLADKRQLLGKEHFSVDGTLIQAWACHKSFVPKDGSDDDADGSGSAGRNGQANWKAKPRSNDTHASRPIRTHACSGRATTRQLRSASKGTS